MTADPAELHNLASEQPERVEALYAELQAVFEAAKARRKPDQVTKDSVDLDKDSQLQKRLRALGYLE